MHEVFKPIAHRRPNGIISDILIFIRQIFDLQFLTIKNDAKRVLKSFAGNILDVGCGDSPYRQYLCPDKVKYQGIDVKDAGHFEYYNTEIICFDGLNIPFSEETFDGLICTEVLEHVERYQELVDEMYRVMKKGGVGFITVPWSARFHYIPYDYFRYTPSALKKIFEKFSKVEISSRGNDYAVVANKLVIIWARNIFPNSKWRYVFALLWFFFLPFLVIYFFYAHLSIILKFGSVDDPLGYTICLRK